MFDSVCCVKIGFLLFLSVLSGLNIIPANATPPYAYRTQVELLSIEDGAAYIYFEEDVGPGSYYHYYKGERIFRLDLFASSVEQLKERRIKHWCHPDTTQKWHKDIIKGDTVDKKIYRAEDSFQEMGKDLFIFDDTGNLFFKSPQGETEPLKSREQIIKFLDQYPLGFPGRYYSFEYFSNPRVKKTYRTKNYLLIEFRFDNYDYGRWKLDYRAILPLEGLKYLASLYEENFEIFIDKLQIYDEKLEAGSFFEAYHLIDDLKQLSEQLPDLEREEKFWSASYREAVLFNKELRLFLESGRYYEGQYLYADEMLQKISAGQRWGRFLELPLDWDGKRWKDPALLRIYIRIKQDRWDEIAEVVTSEPLYLPDVDNTAGRIKQYAGFARQYVEQQDSGRTIGRDANSYFWEIERYFYFITDIADDEIFNKVYELSSHFLKNHPEHHRAGQVWWYKTLALHGLGKGEQDIDWPEPGRYEDSVWHELRRAIFEEKPFNFSPEFLVALMGTSILFEEGPLAFPLSNFLEHRLPRKGFHNSWVQERYYWECMFALQQELSRLYRYHLLESSHARPEEILPEKRDWIFQAMAADYFARTLPGGWTFEDNPQPVFRRWEHFSKMDTNKIPLLTYYSAGSLLYSQQKTWQSLVDLFRLKKLSGENNPFAWDKSTVSELAGELIETLDKKEWPAAPGFSKPVKRFGNLPRSNCFSSRPEGFIFDTTPEGYSFKLEFSLAQPAAQICRPPAIAFLDHRSGGFFRPKKIEINDSIIAEWHWNQKEINRLRKGYPTMAREWTPRYYIVIVPFCSATEHSLPVERITETDYKPPYGMVENIKIISGKITSEMLD